MGFDWKSIVSSVAPVLGTALGGPLGGVAARAAMDALGITPGAEKKLIRHLPAI